MTSIIERLEVHLGKKKKEEKNLVVCQILQGKFYKENLLIREVKIDITNLEVTGLSYLLKQEQKPEI